MDGWPREKELYFTASRFARRLQTEHLPHSHVNGGPPWLSRSDAFRVPRKLSASSRVMGRLKSGCFTAGLMGFIAPFQRR